MIGGMAGGLIDPETLQGAQFSGRSIAGSESGLGRAIIFGTTVVEGRLMDGEDEPRVTRADVGKGGPEVENDVALLSYAIEICESSELRGTKVEAVLAVWEDEKLVYDVRENSLVSDADNAKWKKNKQFFYGEEGQMPSAMLQSIHGVGNVPAYVGTCRMDVEDEDLVLHGERIPRYRFLVSRCPVKPPNHLLVTGQALEEGGPMWTTALVGETLVFEGIPQSAGATIPNGSPAYYNNAWLVLGNNVAKLSTDNRKSWSPIPFPYNAFGPIAAGPGGWLAVGDGSASGFDKTGRSNNISDGFTPYAFSVEFPPGTTRYAHGEEAYMCRYSGAHYYLDVGIQGDLVKTDDIGATVQQAVNIRALESGFGTYYDVEEFGTALYVTASSGGDCVLARSTDGGVTFPEILASAPLGSGDEPFQLQAGGDVLVVYCRNAANVLTSVDGFSARHPTGIQRDFGGVPTQANFLPRQIAATEEGEGEWAFYIISGDNAFDPTLGNKCVRTLDGITFSAPVSTGINSTYGIAASNKFAPTGGGVIIPDAPGYEIDPITGEIVGPDSDIGNACGMWLDDVVREIYRLGSKQITDDMLDLDALSAYYVRGYALQDVGLTSADGIEPLRRVYFFDLPEYDGKIHARLRAGGVDWVIDPNDIIPGEESTLEGKRGDETKYPKRLQLTYAAISTDYKPTTQAAEDINPDTFTNTEEAYQTALVLEDDEAAKVADVMLKVMRIEREKEQKFSLPIQYIGIVASDILDIEGRRYRVDKMRVEKNRIVIERAVRDSQHAYYSDAVGVEGIQRPPPVSSVRGPVASAVMNMPVLRDEDDRAGIYWAGAGYLPGFRGSMLQMSRDGLNFENGPELSVSSTMGLLTADLPEASRYVQDNTNVLKVRMYPGGRDLDSTTFEGLMEERNVAAIVYPDGTTEIIQFQTAVEGTDREYELTGLMRGRQDTIAGEHLTGAQFVLLNDDVRFVAIRPDDVGKTLTFRAVSRGTNPEDNSTQSITFTTIESLREWQPYNIGVTPDGLGGYCVEWIGRARLGSSRTPIHSQWFSGYRVTFTIGTLTHTVDTTEQSLCLSAEEMLEVFGVGHGFPAVTVRAISRVATNDDDFDSAPGTPTTPVPPGSTSEPAAFAGDFPDGYVGIPYLLFPGDNGVVISGGGYSANAYGSIAPGVCVNGENMLSGSFRAGGIPTTVGTANCNVLINSTSPIPGEGGEIPISQSITIAAKPSFSTVDFTFRSFFGSRLVATATPWTTFDIYSSCILYSYGFTTGKRVAEFTIGSVVEDLIVGISCSHGELTPADNSVRADDSAFVFADAGVWRIEIDCATGGWEIFKNNVSDATGTLALPSGKQYRFVCANQWVQNVRVHSNFGNESWTHTPTSGYGGVPMPTVTIPVGWSAPSPIIGMMMIGDGYNGVKTGYKAIGNEPHVALGNIGKSAGKWKFQIGTSARIGMAVASFDRADGLIGAPGTEDSVGWSAGTLHSCLSGVYSSIPAPMPPGASSPIFALDADADRLYVCANGLSGLTTLQTVTLPSGKTWFPAECDAYPTIVIDHNPAGPAGFNAWTLTV